MPRLQILPDKVEITINYYKKRNDLDLLSLSNFSRAAILDFITSLRFPVVSNKGSYALDVIKFKMATRGKLKSDSIFIKYFFLPCLVKFVI